MPLIVGGMVFWNRVFQGRIPEYTWVPESMKGFDPSQTYLRYMETYGTVYNKVGCPWCDTAGSREDDPVYGRYYCLCWLLRERDTTFLRAATDWGSSWKRQSLDEFNTNIAQSGPNGVANLKKAVERTGAWIENPDKWLIYSGPTGVGKTMLLNTIMSAWYPFAIYIVASEFEARLRQYFSNGGDGIQPYIKALCDHPILVLDDLGIEYSTPWIAAKMAAVLEYRSRKSNWQNHLTVLATNIMQRDIKKRFMTDDVSRVGSRLTDFEIVEWLTFDGLPDYRNKSR